MLTEPVTDPHRIPQHSLRQAYAEFIEQRIEEYKEQLSRPELLQLGDEAVRELDERQGQLVLTEVLLHDHVDRLIKKRLRLPSFRRWRERHLRLREAQRSPTHWGLDTETPLARLACYLEPTDMAVVVGSAVASAGMFLAAFDVGVLLIDHDIARIEAAESQAAAESVAGRFHAMVVSLGDWFPDGVFPALVVFDAATLARLDATARVRLLSLLAERTVRGGYHLIEASPSGGATHPLAPEAIQTHYPSWPSERGSRGGRARWFLVRKP